MITAAYTVGAPGLREAPVVLLLQGTLSAGMFMLLRQAPPDRRTPRWWPRPRPVRTSWRGRRPVRTNKTSNGDCTTPCSPPSPW
ncbi:hypothetical protein LV779_27210 [Streptomyces thinghirensis]|nr:hypothetical protein [Streptomyces thinghirensis]